MFLIATLITAHTTHAQTTAFTYQGELNANGTPANGSFDVRFALFPTLSGGTPIGGNQTVSAVPVSEGIFTLQLDFGVDAFPGANRFVEIAVRPAGTGTFTTLAPRQQISATPYAIRTLIATNAEQLGGLPASRYVQSNATGDVNIGAPLESHGKLSVSGGSSSALYGESTTGRGVWGKSASSRGVYGESTTFQGVFGTSLTQAGVAGESTSFHGLFGTAHAQNSAGVFGTNDAGGFGVTGISTAGAGGVGIYGESTSGPGVWGKSGSAQGVRGESATGNAIVGEAHSANNAGVFGTNDADNSYGVRGANTGSGGVAVYGEAATGRGVWGKSVSSRGVYGESQTFQGVFGISNSSTGVHGESAGVNGFGVYGRNLNGFAMGAEGNVTQNRDKGGWVKALVYIDEGGNVQRCFNSFLPGSAASTPPCGFDYVNFSETLGYFVEFPFDIGDRFLNVTIAPATATGTDGIRTGVNIDYAGDTSLIVKIFSIEDPERFDDHVRADFMIAVY